MHCLTFIIFILFLKNIIIKLLFQNRNIYVETKCSNYSTDIKCYDFWKYIWTWNDLTARIDFIYNGKENTLID